jgi:hypothetical protein
MLKELSPGIKISISRSITNVFEQYMNKIEWNDDKYVLEDFMNDWRHYITHSSSWYSQLSDEMKSNPVFHQELAVKINETIKKITLEEPTKAQMKEIEELEQTVGKEYNYSCKLEAKYVIDKLKKELKQQA